VRIIRHSRVYESPPWGKTDQPPFLNQVVEVETTLSPHALLSVCHEAERVLGRVRQERWGPRTVDVDILLYGDLVTATPDLIVPHPELRRRAFVLVPLAEIAPELRLPSGETVESLLAALPDRSAVLATSHE
jgi:2-amino-4-hydroxy-6-hydroxymethyldihydropteridine diphosphokinase